MKVKELISLLQKFPGDDNVRIETREKHGETVFCHVADIDKVGKTFHHSPVIIKSRDD